MLSKWPIRNKLIIGLALLLLLVATLSVSGFVGLYAYRDTIKVLGWRVNEIPPAVELGLRVSDLRMTLAKLETSLGFPSSESSQSVRLLREDFRRNLREARETLEKYREQLDLNDVESGRLSDSRYERDTVRKIEAVLDHIDDVDRDERWWLGTLTDTGLHAELDRLQALAADLPGYLHRNIQAFTEDVRLQYRTLIVLTWAASLLAAGLLVVLVLLFYRWVFRPLRILIKGSRKVAAGQFDYRIQLDSQDEMAELAEAMNAMTARFQSIRDDLDHQVQERTKQVVRSEQLASVGFLAAGVAHEINNPLASIAMCSESLESRLADLNPDDSEGQVVLDYLRMIQTEAFRCKEITEKLLDFSRIGDVRRQPSELGEIVQDVIDMVGHLGKYQGKHIEFQPALTVVAAVNSQEIKQVVLNLLTNALDSLDAGGTVRIELDQRDGQAELTFTDDGCGMTPDVLEHLFEPFFTRRRGGQGTGLGLSISYRIVADHGGSIDAASDGPSRGSQFRVRLPLVKDEKEKHHRYQAQAA